jgi:hypothetical protein
MVTYTAVATGVVEFEHDDVGVFVGEMMIDDELLSTVGLLSVGTVLEEVVVFQEPGRIVGLNGLSVVETPEGLDEAEGLDVADMLEVDGRLKVLLEEVCWLDVLTTLVVEHDFFFSSSQGRLVSSPLLLRR